jgi:hypothetical protein
MTDDLTDAQLEQRKQAAVKHGGEAAIKRLQTGEPFDGLARAAYENVLAELGVNLDRLTGIEQVRVKRAARFEAVARLFDVAALAAAAAGDVEAWERYNRRSGWIGSKAFRALGELRADLAEDEATIIDALDAAREAGNGEP